MKYRKCSHCGEVKANGYDEINDVRLRRCRKCGGDISEDPEYDEPNFFDNYTQDKEVNNTFSLIWEKHNISITIPDDGKDVYIGRAYQDYWEKNGINGENISRKHIKVNYVKEKSVGNKEACLLVTEMGSTNGTLIEDIELINEDGANATLVYEGEKITLDAIGEAAIELVVRKN